MPPTPGSIGNATTTRTTKITNTMPTAANDGGNPLLLLPPLLLPVQEDESDPCHCHLPTTADPGDNASPRRDDSLTLKTALALMDPSYHHHHRGNGGYGGVYRIVEERDKDEDAAPWEAGGRGGGWGR